MLCLEYQPCCAWNQHTDVYIYPNHTHHQERLCTKFIKFFKKLDMSNSFDNLTIIRNKY